MKRTWWGGTTTASPADPYISTDFHPHLRGPDKAPAANVYVGSTTVNGRPAPRFTGPEKFIIDRTYYGNCAGPPNTCSPGYPESAVWYSYWNVKGSFRPLNSNFGGASQTTSVFFPTTMGNTDPSAFWDGNPVNPTTTPCVGGGLTSPTANGYKFHCGAWDRSWGGHYVGEPIRFNAGNYDDYRHGRIKIIPGQNRFGGTMHFFYGPNHIYYQLITQFNTPYISKAYGPQVDLRDPAANTVLGDVQYGGPFNIYQMSLAGTQRATTMTSPPNGTGQYIARRNPYFYTLAPFTTGTVSVSVPLGDHTIFQVSGYDNRTPNGIDGIISLVRPRMVHVYQIPLDPKEPVVMSWTSGSAWQMNFHFLPEPGSTLAMASGLVLLAGLYRMRRR